jgi:histidine phosphotransferase ChpT
MSQSVDISATELTTVDFGEKLCTKLCHDLAGLIGSAAGGLEFIDPQDIPPEAQDAFTLAADSSGRAVARLKLFRFTFGSGKLNGSVSVKGIEEDLQTIFSNSKIILLNVLPATQTLDTMVAKLLLTLVLLANNIIAQEGEVELSLAEGLLKICATAGRATKDIEGLHDMLRRPGIGVVTSDNVFAHYAGFLAKRIGVEVQIQESKEGVIFVFRNIGE